ncbi:MAG: phage integrase SAM-like domain-containing protein [Thermodesulfobacteriota bacterium]
MPNNNYGLKTRDISKAGQFCLANHAQSGDISESSKRTYTERWNIFAQFAKERGIRRLEQISPNLAKEYGQHLTDRISRGEISPATGQHYMGAINRVMHLATQGQWQSVQAVADCGIDRRSRVRTVEPDGQDRGTNQGGRPRDT